MCFIGNLTQHGFLMVCLPPYFAKRCDKVNCTRADFHSAMLGQERVLWGNATVKIIGE